MPRFEFACCNDFRRCSDNRACIKQDNPMYEGCEYRKRLNEGKIFYGLNRNVGPDGQLLKGYQTKRRLEEIGFNIKEDIEVRCAVCGKVHTFKADAFAVDTQSSEGDMGARTEYRLSSEEPCDECGMPMSCIVSLSEYPPGTLEGKPERVCKGCREVRPEIKVEYSDYSSIFRNSYVVDFYIPHASHPELKRPDILLADGKARLFVDGEQIVGRTKIYIPQYGELLEIFTNETGTISFDGDEPRLCGLIVDKTPKGQAMHVLGSVAEAIIVRECAKDDLRNKKWLDIARKGYSRYSTVRRFKAIGTGLNSTRVLHSRKYDKGNPQRDIIWIDENENEAFVNGGTAVSGSVAGLQVKTSTNGVGYVQPDLVKRRYEVPVVYFPINDDFDTIVRNLERKVAAGEIEPVEIGVDFIDGRKVDPEAYEELQLAYSILEALFSNRMKPKEFVEKVRGNIPMQNALLGNVLEEGATRIVTYR